MTEFDSRDARELKSMEAPKLSDFKAPYIQRQITIQDDGKTVTLYSDNRVLVTPKSDTGLILDAVREILKR